MGRYTTKCSRAVDELAVMEVTQVVGARTRARTLALSSGAAAAGPKRRNAAAPPPEVVQTSSYLQLRSRRLVMLTRGKTQRPVNSSASSNPDPSVEGVSRCSSNASSEVVFNKQEGEVLDSSTCNFESRRARREMPPSNEAQCEAGDLESMMEARSSWRRAEATPTQAEIEEFFAAAEREQAQQFAGKYNYDVVHDVPFDGRFEWVRIN
ncbi:cyclin-dependent kinase inhibitor [Musa troglodytarum]|uniref:Cyclin-dependent kinase inhibitor n=1 Tax=Musa troglodytarum TaxID=320322 RepID=A0A9E7KWR0_9LILI|nr:cyclin-dependent kinase inhibitor [Musa troglodytarum]URE29948.1 cyclin-dependent kinase inhibitor [Musa troglodytarum]